MMGSMSRRRDAEAAIRCVDLSVSRGVAATRIVDGVTFTLDRGRAIVVMGPTGAGKSTLAGVLAGGGEGAAVVGGRAEVDGIPVRRTGRAHRLLTYVTGYVRQGEAARLPSRLTVAELIESPVTSRDRRVNRRALSVRVASLLDELMLPLGVASKYPYELSAGMRQRVVLARALMLDPRVLIADELHANVDVEAKRAMTAAIVRRRDGYGMSTLLIANETALARAVAADVLVLRAGHAVAYGHDSDELVWSPTVDADDRLVAS